MRRFSLAGGAAALLYNPAMAKPYESDITRMIRELLQEKPHIVEDQKKGRAIWWDKKLDPEALKRAEESNVRQQGYVYQNKV